MSHVKLTRFPLHPKQVRFMGKDGIEVTVTYRHAIPDNWRETYHPFMQDENVWEEYRAPA